MYVRHVPTVFLLFLFYTSSEMEATIDIEFLEGNISEKIIKELAVVSVGVVQTFLLRPPII